MINSSLKFITLFFVFFITFPNYSFSQNTSNLNSAQLSRQHIVILSAWYAEKKCSFLNKTKKEEFNKNATKFNQTLLKNLTNKAIIKEIQEVQILIKNNYENGECTKDKLSLVNASFEILKYFSPTTGINAQPYISKEVSDIGVMTDALMSISIARKCNFYSKKDEGDFFAYYMTALMTFDQLYKPGSPFSLLLKLAMEDINYDLLRKVKCDDNSKKFTKKSLKNLKEFLN